MHIRMIRLYLNILNFGYHVDSCNSLPDGSVSITLRYKEYKSPEYLLEYLLTPREDKG